MFKTLFSHGVHVNKKAKSIPGLGIQPSTALRRTSVSRHISRFEALELNREFSEFDRLFFVDCSAAGSELADGTCAGARSKDVLVVSGQVPYLYLLDTLGSHFTQLEYSNRKFCLCFGSLASPLETLVRDPLTNAGYLFEFSLDTEALTLPLVTQLHPRAPDIAISHYEVPFIKLGDDCKLEAKLTENPHIRYFEKTLASDCFDSAAATCSDLGTRVLLMEQLITSASNKAQGFAKIDIDNRLVLYLDLSTFRNSLYELQVDRNAVRCGASSLRYAFGDSADPPLLLPFHILDFAVLGNDLLFSKSFKRVAVKGSGLARSSLSVLDGSLVRRQVALVTRNIFVRFYIQNAPQGSCNWKADGTGFRPKASLLDWTDEELVFSPLDFRENDCHGGQVFMNITVERALYSKTGQLKRVFPKATESVYVGKVQDCTSGLSCDECSAYSQGCASCGLKFLNGGSCVDKCPVTFLNFEYFSPRANAIKHSNLCLAEDCSYGSTKVYAECVRCSPVCATCLGVSEHQCSSCSDGQVLMYGTCVEACDPQTQYQNFTSGQCLFTRADESEGFVDFELMNVSTADGFVRLRRAIPLGIKVNYRGTSKLAIEWKVNSRVLSAADNDRLFGGLRNATTVVLFPYTFDSLHAKNNAVPKLATVMQDLQISVKISAASMSLSRVFYFKLRKANAVSQLVLNSPVGGLPRNIYSVALFAERGGFYYSLRLADPSTGAVYPVLANTYSMNSEVTFYNVTLPYLNFVGYANLIVGLIDEFGYLSEYTAVISVQKVDPPSVFAISSVILYQEVASTHQSTLSEFMQHLVSLANVMTKPYNLDGRQCISHFQCGGRGVCVDSSLLLTQTPVSATSASSDPSASSAKTSTRSSLRSSTSR